MAIAHAHQRDRRTEFPWTVPNSPEGRDGNARSIEEPDAPSPVQYMKAESVVQEDIFNGRKGGRA